MKLQDKLDSIQPSQVVMELDSLLQHARIELSWWAKRLVAVDGYEGGVSLQELWLKYRQATPFRYTQYGYAGPAPSLQERMICFHLWGKIEDLEHQSVRELNATTSVYRLVVGVLEQLPAFTIDGSSSIDREDIFNFSQDEYQRRWGDRPAIKSVHRGYSSWLQANYKMVEAALQEQSRAS